MYQKPIVQPHKIRSTHATGFTLIELIVAMAVLAMVVGYVMNSFSGMLARQRLQAAAENLYDYLTLARTESISRSSPAHISIVDGASWCFGIDDSASCTCSTSNDCQVDGATRTTSYDSYTGITLSSVDASLSQFTYDERRGMPQNTAGTASVSGNITFTNVRGDAVTLQLNSVGRIKLCTTTGFRGYSACP